MWRGHLSRVCVRPTDRSVFGQSLVLVPLAPLVVAAMLFRLLRNRAQCGLWRAVRLPSAAGRATYAGAPEGLHLSFSSAPTNNDGRAMHQTLWPFQGQNFWQPSGAHAASAALVQEVRSSMPK